MGMTIANRNTFLIDPAGQDREGVDCSKVPVRAAPKANMQDRSTRRTHG
jgi:hypothetical protein